MTGPLAAARDPDDDPGAVAEPRDDDAGAEGVLRVPLVADGAVGRPGVDRVHRRHGDRRGARSQRPAAVALLRHQGRPRRSWRPKSACSTSRPRTSCSRSGCTRAASSWSTRRRAASSPTRRSSASSPRRSPYGEWLTSTWSTSRICRPAPYLPPPSHETVLQRQQLFGYTARRSAAAARADGDATARKPIGSMGTDTSLAVLSDRPRLLYDYFKQLFAQVTNPPLDAIREELVTSMGSTIGPEGNLLEPRPESCRQIKIKYPVIDNDQLGEAAPRLRARVPSRSRCRCCSTRAQDGRGLERALERSEAARQRRGRRRLHDPDPVGPRRRSRSRADSEPARDGRRAPPSGPRRARARAARWSSSRATRAKCITARCCSATAPARSIRTSRSRRSTT